MTPPCFTFPASRLPQQVQLDVHGRKRKLPGGRDVDLLQCELLSAVQYHCSVEHPEQTNSPVRCWPVQRLFRRCVEDNGLAARGLRSEKKLRCGKSAADPYPT